MNEVASTITWFLAGIGGIGLLVGGIGIMNIMLVSVTERTREIGIRKSLGAKKKHIFMQFLLEALVLSVAGGIIGIGAGKLLGDLMTKIIQIKFIFSVRATVIAILFSSAVGLFFGVYPAQKAARLNPVDALRYE
jgi:putative ABC transport system permease protein